MLSERFEIDRINLVTHFSAVNLFHASLGNHQAVLSDIESERESFPKL